TSSGHRERYRTGARFSPEQMVCLARMPEVRAPLLLLLLLLLRHLLLSSSEGHSTGRPEVRLDTAGESSGGGGGLHSVLQDSVSPAFGATIIIIVTVIVSGSAYLCFLNLNAQLMQGFSRSSGVADLCNFFGSNAELRSGLSEEPPAAEDRDSSRPGAAYARDEERAVCFRNVSQVKRTRTAEPDQLLLNRSQQAINNGLRGTLRSGGVSTWRRSSETDMAGFLDNFRWPECECIDLAERRNTVASIVAGILL
ncbi:transmembrane protein 50B, partial [Clarias magur]